MVTLRRMTRKGSAATGVVTGILKDAAWQVRMGAESDYIYLGQHTTMVPDALYPYAMFDVRNIRIDRDPGFCPLFRRVFYRTRAGGIISFAHHGVGRFDPRGQSDPGLVGLQRPTIGYGARIQAPNIVERWFVGKTIPGSRRAKNNLPPPFIPWGSWVRAWCNDVYLEASAAQKRKWLDEHPRHTEARREREHQEKEAAYVQKHEEPIQKALLESITPADEREMVGRAIGAIRPEPKLFSDLGAKA